MLLMIDNYDSFTYNLVHLFRSSAPRCACSGTMRSRRTKRRQLAPSHVVISPGPGRPADAGVSVDVIRRLGPRVPTLGVCLGHQAIVAAFGGEVGQAQALLHGKSSPIEHDGKGIFAGLPANFEAGRYHSLAALNVPAELEVTARTPDGEVMGVRHRELPIEGVQFHPESVLTPLGHELAENFLSR